MSIKIKRKWQFSLEIFMIVLGTAIMGIAFSWFLEPNNISTGGFSGLSMVLSALFNKIGAYFLSSSIIYFILNIGLYIYALKALGKNFAIKALIGISSFSIWIELFKLIPISISYEPLISCIYGGAIMGVGIGIVVRFGGSTGGSDMIACIIKKTNPKLTIGTISTLVNLSAIIPSLFVFDNGFDMLPYTIIALLLDMVVIDYVVEGYRQIKAFYIITDKKEAVSDAIIKHINRGCTCLEAQGMHSKSNKTVIICLVNKFQVPTMMKIIKDIDKDAFIFSIKVSELYGKLIEQPITTEEFLQKNKEKQ